MSMVTQCPHCSTAFNVTPEQLFARDGRVRCGHCTQVFDGLVNLTSLEALQAGVPPPLADSSAAAQQADAQSHETSPTPLPEHGFSPVNWPMLPDVPQVPVPPLPLEVVADAAQASLRDTYEKYDRHETQDGEAHEARLASMAAKGSLASPPAVSEYRVSEEIRVEDVEPAPSTRRVSVPWALAATLAALLLCGQALYSFRSEIAAHFPAMKPALAQACGWARCSVPPLQRPTVLSIQASDLLILDKAKPHLVQLIVTLQNQSALDVGYPAIDLVLNDRFDHAIARRVFVPADYLRGADAQKTVIAASVTTTVRIDLDVSELSAGGFGLLLIPAPQT